MVSTFLIAVPVTILPAMAALWVHLRRYEGYFEDARVFFSLIVGFFAGLVATSFEVALFPFADPLFVEAMGVWTAVAFFVLGYAFFETGMKTAVLGLRRFRQRKDTPYYGVALGLGFGAMAALLFVARGLQALQDPILDDVSANRRLLWQATVILVPVGTVFTHGATGVWVGLGSADGRLLRGWITGTLLQLPAMAAMWLLLGPVGAYSDLRFVGAAVLSVGYGTILLHVTRKKVLDTIVPPEIRAQVRRDIRARRRGEATEPAPAEPEMVDVGPGRES